MGGQDAKLTGPDLEAGIPEGDLVGETPLLGHAHGEAVIVVRRNDDVLAIGATCTHYGGPLAEGLFGGDTVRCPWHHACFDLRTGAPVRAPALNPIPCYEVAITGGLIRVGARTSGPVTLRRSSSLRTVAIVGAGAAGESAAETLRREGYDGEILLFGADESPPVDRPNLSKDYLAGNAPEEWIPLRPPAFFGEQKIALTLGARVASIDPGGHKLTLADGRDAAHSGGQPRDHRTRHARATGRRGGRELHRHGGRGVAPRAQPRGACRRAGRGSVRAHARPRAGRVHARAARGARRPLPPRQDGGVGRARRRHAVWRRRAHHRRHGRARRRRPA